MLQMVDTLLRANEAALKSALSNPQSVSEALIQCQESAIMLGTYLETLGENYARLVQILEAYCENIYQMNEGLSDENKCRKISKKIQKQLTALRNNIKYDMPDDKKQVVFLPYKASMWDSLESVWRAADDDPDCEAYVIPIPYYEKNADGTLGQMHYEGDEFPVDVPVTGYEDYDFEAERPDVIFIHNPYDKYNFVTSVHPFFYSDKLKKVTDCLVYIPYFTMSGGMGESKALCPAYVNADYIIVQAEKYCKFFDSELPKEKLVPLGSPKFDKVLRLCNQQVELPEKWRKKAEGKKLYFYNTSINGMLANTEKFLKKIEYVFHCFEHRDDACLVWRPHPLLESTFDSMRKEYRPIYEILKSRFIENGCGIYDDSPDIETTIALCDAYIGDGSSSVVSLFGIAGKPIFRLNNNICSEPQEDDWRGEIVNGFFKDGQDQWKITQGNKLYYAPNNDYQYEYYCDLSDYAIGNLYLRAIEINGKIYICPANAQDILIVKDRKIIKKIALKRYLESTCAFYDAWSIGEYIFLVPMKYPAIVRLDTRNDEVSYLMKADEIFIKNKDSSWGFSGSCVWKQYLLIASAKNNKVLFVDSESMEMQVLTTGAKNNCGCLSLTNDGNDIWLLPYKGKTVTRWNPETGEVWEYANFPNTFRCTNLPYGFECEERPFSSVVPYKDYMIFAPYWGNMFLQLDKETGEFCEWKPPFEVIYEEKNDYFPLDVIGMFIRKTERLGEWTYSFFDIANRKLYDIDLETGAYQENPIVFNRNELMEHVAGFSRGSDWHIYFCDESAFNSLTDLLNETIKGNAFNREEQMHAYQETTANTDGTCGKNVYDFVRGRV